LDCLTQSRSSALSESEVVGSGKLAAKPMIEITARLRGAAASNCGISRSVVDVRRWETRHSCCRTVPDWLTAWLSAMDRVCRRSLSEEQEQLNAPSKADAGRIHRSRKDASIRVHQVERCALKRGGSQSIEQGMQCRAAPHGRQFIEPVRFEEARAWSPYKSFEASVECSNAIRAVQDHHWNRRPVARGHRRSRVKVANRYILRLT
jgi:hypothetical protein